MRSISRVHCRIFSTCTREGHQDWIVAKLTSSSSSSFAFAIAALRDFNWALITMDWGVEDDDDDDDDESEVEVFIDLTNRARPSSASKTSE